MRLRVNYRLADKVDELFENRKLVVDDGWISREIAKALRPLRKRGDLFIGYDQRLCKSVLVLSDGVEKKKRRRVPFGTSIFDVF